MSSMNEGMILLNDLREYPSMTVLGCEALAIRWLSCVSFVQPDLNSHKFYSRVEKQTESRHLYIIRNMSVVGNYQNRRNGCVRNLRTKLVDGVYATFHDKHNFIQFMFVCDTWKVVAVIIERFQSRAS